MCELFCLASLQLKVAPLQEMVRTELAELKEGLAAVERELKLLPETAGDADAFHGVMFDFVEEYAEKLVQLEVHCRSAASTSSPLVLSLALAPTPG